LYVHCYPHIFYIALCTFLLGVRTVKLLKLTIFSLILLNLQIILYLLCLMTCLIMVFSLLYDTDSKFQKEECKTLRKIDKYITFNFHIKHSFESWESVFENNDIDMMFNSVLNTYLIIFYSIFCIKNTEFYNQE
jgi:hypothetical protein